MKYKVTNQNKIQKKEKIPVIEQNAFKIDLFGKEQFQLLAFNYFGKSLLFVGFGVIIAYLGGLLATFADNSNDQYKSVQVLNIMQDTDEEPGLNVVK